jgi:hypothetical protein
MAGLISIFTQVLSFFRANLYKIIVGLVVTLVAALAFYVTLFTLRKLKSEVLAYYPFDRFFPQSGKWSVLYFLIVIVFLGALAYFLAKGGFYLGPA